MNLMEELRSLGRPGPGFKPHKQLLLLAVIQLIKEKKIKSARDHMLDNHLKDVAQLAAVPIHGLGHGVEGGDQRRHFSMARRLRPRREVPNLEAPDGGLEDSHGLQKPEVEHLQPERGNEQVQRAQNQEELAHATVFEPARIDGGLRESLASPDETGNIRERGRAPGGEFPRACGQARQILQSKAVGVPERPD